MTFSNSLADSDDKERTFCARGVRKLGGGRVQLNGERVRKFRNCDGLLGTGEGQSGERRFEDAVFEPLSFS